MKHTIIFVSVSNICTSKDFQENTCFSIFCGKEDSDFIISFQLQENERKNDVIRWNYNFIQIVAY